MGCALWGQGRQKVAPATWVDMAGVTGDPREVGAQQAERANGPAGSWAAACPSREEGSAAGWRGPGGGKATLYKENVPVIEGQKT